MPIYICRCKRCGNITEKTVSVAQKEKDIICASCGARDVEKATTSFFGSGCGTRGGYRFN
jgi:putative FmdB family regulatory protein